MKDLSGPYNEVCEELERFQHRVHEIWLTIDNNVLSAVAKHRKKHHHMDAKTQQELADIQQALALIPGLVQQINDLKTAAANTTEEVPSDVQDAIDALDVTALAAIQPTAAQTVASAVSANAAATQATATGVGASGPVSPSGTASGSAASS